MTWIILQFLFLIMPVAITSALYKSNHRFMDRFYERMVRNEKARKLHTWVLLTVLLLYHYVYTNGHPGGFGVLLSTGACAALFSSRRTDRWLRGLSGRPRAFAVLALTAVAIGFVPGLYTVAVTAAYCLLAALFYPSARAMSECDGKEVEPGRAEPPATSAVPHRYDHRAGLPHDADGGSSDISAHDYHQ